MRKVYRLERDMTVIPSVSFATFCYSQDAHRLHAPGQLQKQVESNGYDFDEIIVIHQLCCPDDYKGEQLIPFQDFPRDHIRMFTIEDLDSIIFAFDINIDKPQYVSDTDRRHTWKNHVANHLAAVMLSKSDYIVFADNDCRMVRQPNSWVRRGINILKANPSVFMVSPNDGEGERFTRRISQQMFMARTEEFRQADFNQPGWDGNVNVSGGPFPEYWALLEGRIELHCRVTNQHRYVLGPEYRYWHHNRIRPDGMLETDLEKYQ
jgi:hypothetical protein